MNSLPQSSQPHLHFHAAKKSIGTASESEDSKYLTFSFVVLESQHQNVMLFPFWKLRWIPSIDLECYIYHNTTRVNVFFSFTLSWCRLLHFVCSTQNTGMFFSMAPLLYIILYRWITSALVPHSVTCIDGLI